MAESLAIKMTVLNRFRQRSHSMPGRKARVRYSLHPRQSSGSAPMLVKNLVPGHSSGHRVPVCARLCWLRLCIPMIPSDTYVSKWRLTGRNGANMWTVLNNDSICARNTTFYKYPSQFALVVKEREILQYKTDEKLGRSLNYILSSILERHGCEVSESEVCKPEISQS